MPDNTPTKDILVAYHNQNLDWKTVLGELVDNSFDAAAKRVVIEFGIRLVAVTDNGAGCTDTAGMLQLGRHSAHPSTRSGRFGVGLKYAALWLWGVTRISSSDGSIVRCQKMDWQRYVTRPEWELPDPQLIPATLSSCKNQGLLSRTGTRIECSKIARNLPSVSQMVGFLGFQFMPALKSGRALLLKDSSGKTHKAAQYKLPKMSEQLEATMSIAGRDVPLKVGIVAEGEPNPHPGFLFTHAHRVLYESSLGCGEFGSERIAGIVELPDEWEVSTNKNDISEHKDELEARIYKACSGMLSRAQREGIHFKSAALETEISELVNAAVFGREKRKRKPDPEPGTKPKSETNGKKTKRPRNTQPGTNPLDQYRGGRLKVTFGQQGANEPIAIVRLGGPEIILNEDRSAIGSLKSRNDKHGICMLACSLLAAKVASSDGDDLQKQFRWKEDSPMFSDAFMKGLGHLLDRTPANGNAKRNSKR